MKLTLTLSARAYRHFAPLAELLRAALMGLPLKPALAQNPVPTGLNPAREHSQRAHYGCC